MNSTLREALRLREQGYAVHWLRPNSKAPLEDGWASRPVPTAEELKRTYQPGYNVGFRPGKWSVVDGREVVVLDVDIKDPRFADEAYAVADTIMDGAYDPHVKSGSGVGRHQYVGVAVGTSPDKAAITLRESDIWMLDGKPCDPGTKGARPAWLIELLSTGKNVVLPPSIHPDTLQPYEWLRS